jgi:hypothetical protein
MDLHKVLAELLRERDLIDDAIAHLERLPWGTHGASNDRPRGRGHAAKPPEQARTAGADLD